jgi:hypothetical protein
VWAVDGWKESLAWTAGCWAAEPKESDPATNDDGVDAWKGSVVLVAPLDDRNGSVAGVAPKEEIGAKGSEAALLTVGEEPNGADDANGSDTPLLLGAAPNEEPTANGSALPVLLPNDDVEANGSALLLLGVGTVADTGANGSEALAVVGAAPKEEANGSTTLALLGVGCKAEDGANASAFALPPRFESAPNDEVNGSAKLTDGLRTVFGASAGVFGVVTAPKELANGSDEFQD